MKIFHNKGISFLLFIFTIEILTFQLEKKKNLKPEFATIQSTLINRLFVAFLDVYRNSTHHRSIHMR